MALIIKDRVKEITTTTGTGAVSLGGASATFDAFSSVMSNGDTTFYAIVHTASGTDEWEVGLGTWNTGNTLTRTTVYAGSNGTSAVNFSSGNKDIFMTYPASKAAVAGEDVTFADVTATDITSTGTVTLSADPSSALQAATKQYVDTIAAAGIHYHTPVRVEHPSNLNATYNNGSSGVGATLTNAGTNAALVLDNVSMVLNDRVLVANQTNQTQNGVYTVTTVGDGSTAWVLTRSTDTDSYAPSDGDSLGEGDAFFIKEGDTNAGHLDVMTTSGTITFGTTNIVFSEVAETSIYSAGTGLTLTGTTFSTNQDISTSASPTFNSITVTGTVDGRDVATDGSKLDGIEAGATADQTASEIKTAYESNSNTNAFTDAEKTKLSGVETGATADQTASEILTAIKTVDGAASGLDADLLDGLQGSSYLNTSTTFSGDVSGTYNNIVVANDSHTHDTRYLQLSGGTITGNLTVNSGTDNEGISVVSTDAGSYVSVADNGTTGSTRFGAVSNDFKIDVNSSERMRIDSSGRVGIGTSSPSAKLNVVGSAADNGISIKSGGNGGVDPFKVTWSGGTEGDMFIVDDGGKVGIGTNSPIEKITANGAIVSTASNGTGSTSGANRAILDFTSGGARIGHFRGTTAAGSGYASFYTDSTERMRIDSSGRVGIGTSTPSRTLTLVDATSDGSGGLLIQNYLPVIELDDASGGGTSTIIKHDGTNTIIENGGSEAMRIDSSGNLLVGKSTLDYEGTAGTIIRNDGLINAARSGGNVTDFNRLSSDGEVVRISKDGTTVGSIGVRDGTSLYIQSTASNRTGLDLSGGVLPRYGGSLSNGQTDLGAASYRFKDLYLSGNITGPSQVTRDINTSSLALAGGTNSNVGANILLYGGSHASLAGITRFRNGSSERMRIDSSGNLILKATSDTGNRLQINGADETSELLEIGITSGHAQLTATHAGGGSNTSGFIFRTRGGGSTAERMRIDSSGNVGIGCTPDQKLHVKGTTELQATNSTNGWQLYTYTDNTFRVNYNGAGADELVIESGGNVGIGTTNPIADLSIVDSSTGSGIEIQPEITTNTNRITNYDRAESAYKKFRLDASEQQFYISGTERMRIDSSGNVLVGTTNANPTGNHEPGTLIAEYGQINVHRDGGNPLRVGSSVNGNLTEYYKQGALVGSIASSSGTFQLSANTNLTYKANVHTFDNAAGSTEYMRIDSSGNLLVGKSVTTLNTTGLNVNGPDGRLEATASGNVSGIFNRTSSNGDIVSFRKDGTEVGSISTASEISLNTTTNYVSLKVDGETSGIQYSNAGTRHVGPWLNFDGAVDLGRSNGRFKDLYLSGAVNAAYLGLGVAANTSGDYRLNMGGHIDMNNYEINYVSQLHFQDNVRFYDDGNNNYLNFKWGNAGDGGIRFRDGQGVQHGYIYGDGSGRFGLLDDDGNWAVRIGVDTEPLQLLCNNNAEFYVYDSYTWSPGSSRAPIFYDSDNTSYYVDPHSISRFNLVEAEGFHAKDGGDYFTFYGDNSGYHGITSRDHAGSVADDLRINSYGGVWINLDSNSNNSSGADFKIGRHGASQSAINQLGLFYVLADSMYVGTDYSFRAPIFYDSNNTAYYFDGSHTGDSIRVAGNIVAYYSDERLKDIEGNIDSPLEKVSKLNGFYYTANEKAQQFGYAAKREVGVSAQEVEAVLPEIVTDAPIGHGYKTVDYSKMVPLLIEAIKEQQQQIDELKAKLGM